MSAVFRALLGYCFLVVMVRIAGRRPGKQMTPMEFVLVFFSGGLALTFMVADEHSMVNALTQIMTVAMAHVSVAWLKNKSPSFGRIVDGTPLMLVQDGQWQVETMTKMRIQDDDVMATARDQGLERLDQIEYAVLERNGEIIIIPRPE